MDLGIGGIDNPRNDAQHLFLTKSTLLHVHPCLYGGDVGHIKSISPGVRQEIESEPNPGVKSTGGCGCRFQKYCGHVDKGSRDFLSRSIFFSFSHLRTLPLVMLALPLALAALAGSAHAQITGTFPATPLASITGLSYPSGVVSIPFYSYTSATSTTALS